MGAVRSSKDQRSPPEQCIAARAAAAKGLRPPGAESGNISSVIAAGAPWSRGGKAPNPTRLGQRRPRGRALLRLGSVQVHMPPLCAQGVSVGLISLLRGGGVRVCVCVLHAFTRTLKDSMQNEFNERECRQTCSSKA